MSRSGLTRTKFPANDKLLPTSHATPATPKTSQFLLISSLLCKAMIVFSRRLRLLDVVGRIDFAAATGRLETRSYQQLVRRAPISFFAGGCSSSAEQKRCRKSRHLVFANLLV